MAPDRETLGLGVVLAPADDTPVPVLDPNRGRTKTDWLCGYPVVPGVPTGASIRSTPR